METCISKPHQIVKIMTLCLTEGSVMNSSVGPLSVKMCHSYLLFPQRFHPSMLRFTPCQSKQFASLLLFFSSSSSRSFYLSLYLSVPFTWNSLIRFRRSAVTEFISRLFFYFYYFSLFSRSFGEQIARPHILCVFDVVSNAGIFSFSYFQIAKRSLILFS